MELNAKQQAAVDMATQKHPVFNWAEFCKTQKVGG